MFEDNIKGPVLTAIYLGIGAASALVVTVIILFNQLVSKRNMANNGWADIDVQ